LKKRHKNKDNFGGAKVPQFPGREKESENQRLFEEMKMLKAENEKLKNMLKKNQFENDFSLDSHLHLTSNRLAKQVANSVALGEEYALKLATIQSRTQEHQSLSQMIAFNKNNL